MSFFATLNESFVNHGLIFKQLRYTTPAPWHASSFCVYGWLGEAVQRGTALQQRFVLLATLVAGSVLGYSHQAQSAGKDYLYDNVKMIQRGIIRYSHNENITSRDIATYHCSAQRQQCVEESSRSVSYDFSSMVATDCTEYPPYIHSMQPQVAASGQAPFHNYNADSQKSTPSSSAYFTPVASDMSTLSSVSTASTVRTFRMNPDAAPFRPASTYMVTFSLNRLVFCQPECEMSCRGPTKVASVLLRTAPTATHVPCCVRRCMYE
ncbi:hypothetical protein Tcan_17707 [Toxocara canis]|uniref:Uncharacterized protein n=1 Tax=Toxocara canis TaxID=6265 RepID=A0A0B2UX98_TOXCA|nr:hypothetical protein Tcan_17707 [Toxocara canis]